MSTPIIRALATGPPLVISAGLWLVLLAAVPHQLAAALLAVGATGAVVLWRAPGQRWVLGARRLRSDEAAALAEVTTRLCRGRLGPPLVELLVTRNRAIAARGSGRRAVVLTSGLLDAVRDGQLPPDQASAVLAHAAGVVRAGLVRADPVLWWLTLPYSALAVAVTVVSWPFRRLPATGTAWRWRAVLVVVAVVQQVSQGLFALAAAIAAIGALSYLVPAWQQAWEALLVRTGDRCVVDAGYAPALIAFLRRCPATEVTRARLLSLTADAQPARSLGLVRA